MFIKSNGQRGMFIFERYPYQKLCMGILKEHSTLSVEQQSFSHSR